MAIRRPGKSTNRLLIKRELTCCLTSVCARRSSPTPRLEKRTNATFFPSGDIRGYKYSPSALLAIKSLRCRSNRSEKYLQLRSTSHDLKTECFFRLASATYQVIEDLERDSPMKKVGRSGITRVSTDMGQSRLDGRGTRV
jgi:hypothetical protein